MKIKCPVRCFRECEFDENTCMGDFYSVNGVVVGCDEIVTKTQISRWFIEQVKERAIEEAGAETLKDYYDNRGKH